MKKGLTALLCVVFSVMLLFTGTGYAALSHSLTTNAKIDLTAQTGIFIYTATLSSHQNANVGATSVNNLFGTNLNSTVALSSDDGASTLTFTVTFYNNSSQPFYYTGATYLEDDAAYDNDNISFTVNGFSENNLINLPIIDAKSFLTCNITFSYVDGDAITNSVLNSTIHFSFGEMETSLVSVVEGTSADNINAIRDGSTFYNGSNTQYRWTNWSADDNDRGKSVAMNLAWPDAITFDQIDLYHFIDHYGCDFPDSVEFYYYDEATAEYVVLTNYTTSTNFTNAARNASGLYTMTINGRTVTFTHNYSGAAPCTTYQFSESITTRGLKIVFKAKAGYFVGLMEIVISNQGVQID